MSRRRRLAPALVASAAAVLIALLLPVGARAGDGAVADAIRQAFGGAVSGAGATDGQALVWTAATRAWGPGTAGGGAWADSTVSCNLTTNTTTTSKVRRDGPDAIFRVKLVFSGAPDVGNATLTLPVTIDTAAFPGGVGSTTTKLGHGTFLDTGTNRYAAFSVWYASSTTVVVLSDTLRAASIGSWLEANGTQALVTIASGDELCCEFRVPVSGW